MANKIENKEETVGRIKDVITELLVRDHISCCFIYGYISSIFLRIELNWKKEKFGRKKSIRGKNIDTSLCLKCRSI